LQSKIEAKEKRKVEIQDATLGSMQPQLEEKAKKQSNTSTTPPNSKQRL